MEAQQRLGGRYMLLNELGKGGMAVVWRAHDEVLGRPVAVKVLAGRYAGNPQQRARIRDEARAAAALSHPNIAQVYDFGESSENGELIPYVVMEMINGPTLAQKVGRGPLPPKTVFQICSEVGAALAAAHADGLVHRDIKPANVMVTPSGAKVVDFGLAAVAGPVRPDEELFGTPAYLAPERLTGGGDVLPASDVYALGVLLYRLLANVSPWSVESTTQMLDAHIYIEPQPLPELPGVPASVVDLVHRCLHKEPSSRPTAAEVSSVLATAELVPPAPVQAAPVPEAPRRRKRLALAGGGVALVVAAALLAWAVVPDAANGEGDSFFGAPPASSGPPAANAPVAPDPASPQQQDASGAGANGAPAAGGGRSPAPDSPGPGEDTAAPQPTAEPPPSTPPPPSSAPTSEPPADSKTLTSTVGSVEARCVRAKAHLTGWTAKDPYVVERVNAGPVLAASAIFKNKLSRVRMTVTCVAGAPTAVVLPL